MCDGLKGNGDHVLDGTKQKESPKSRIPTSVAVWYWVRIKQRGQVRPQTTREGGEGEGDAPR